MFNRKFGHGSVSNVMNTKLKVENGKLIVSLIDAITRKPVSKHTYDEDDFISLYGELRTQEYRISKAANTHRLLIPNKITISLTGYMGERQIIGSFSWSAEARLQKDFMKLLTDGHINRLYRSLVAVDIDVDGGSFSRQFSDMRDCFFVQCAGCLKEVDAYDARNAFNQVCFAVPRVFGGDINAIEPFEEEFTLICERCGNHIKYRIKITVEFPKTGAGMIKAYRFWKNPELEL